MPLSLLAAALLSSTAPQTGAPIEVPFRLGDHAIIVDAVVNDRPVSLMFDTGFSGYVVVGTHINLGKPTGSMTLQDFVGTLQADTVKIKTLKLGGRSIKVEKDAQAVVQGGNDYSLSYNTHCDGVMGFSVIKDNITEINFEKKKFIIYPDGYDIAKRPVDNKSTFLNKLLPLGNASLEMRVKTDAGKSMTLALDTGNAFYATTHKDVLERTGVWTPGRKPKFVKQSFVASGAVDSWSLRLPNTTIFGVPVEDSVWDIIDRPSSSAEGDGTVGFGFLKNFNILIDYDKRRVWLQNWTGQTSDDEAGDIGINAYYDDAKKRTVIYNVMPDSPAGKAGVKRGDLLVAVDGKDVENVGQRRLRTIFEGKEGTTVAVSISRNGALKTLTLTRAHLVNDVRGAKPAEDKSAGDKAAGDSGGAKPGKTGGG